MRRLPTLLALLIALPVAAQQTEIGRARITYLAGGLAYLDAGRDDGLREGQRLQVQRQNDTVAVLTVTYLASRRAACTIVSGAERLAVGDSVTFTRAVPVVVRADTAAAAGSLRSRRNHGLHGRLGLRYLVVSPPEGSSFTQPALDLRLDATEIGGTPLGIVADVRARRNYRRLADGSSTVEARNAVYQAALLVRPGGPARFTIGRQYLPSVSSVTLFDGALVEYQRTRFGAGVFAGAEPDPARMGIGDTRDYGGFVQVRSVPRQRVRWAVAGGAVGSYVDGTVNREFGFLQASIAGPRFTLFAAQEFDANRGWKAEAGEPGVTFTSTFASVALRPAEWLDLHGGVDSRRNVRLYRDFESPEVVFDDSFRRGVWGGISMTPASRIRLGLDGRMAFAVDSTTRLQSGTGWVSVDRISRLGLALRSRHTRYGSVGRRGWLQTFGLGFRPAFWIGLEGRGGLRRETLRNEASDASWFGADIDLTLGRRVYLFLSGTRETGGLAAGDQILGSLSWRF